MRYRFLPVLSLALIATVVSNPAPALANDTVLANDNVAIAPLPGLPGPKYYLPKVEDILHLELDLTKKRVTLFKNDKAYKSFPVAVGKAGWETPTGSHEVKTMYKNPPWANPFKGGVIPGGSPNNPLGTRWIGFWTNGKNWVGFHGTPNRQSVGRAASHGCVRMYNEHVEELFELIKIGTPVLVRR